jgi:hypothetical protein
MSTSADRQFLQRELVEMDKLLEVSADDAVMSFALQKRRESLEREMLQAPAAHLKPRAVLFFAGPPILGSQGIDAMFAASILQPFLEMVKTQYSSQKHGRVGARGPRKDESEAKLFLTGLPRGSFGLELSQPQPGDFIAAEQLSDVLVRLTEVLASAADTDERFAVSLDKISPRVLPRLKTFLDVIADENAYLRVESGDLKVVLLQDQVRLARDRVSAAKSFDEVIKKEGVFRGATLDSWRFDFRPSDGLSIAGRISDEVEEKDVEAMSSLTNRQCLAELRLTTITTRDGAQRHRYELLSLENPSGSQ